MTLEDAKMVGVHGALGWGGVYLLAGIRYIKTFTIYLWSDSKQLDFVQIQPFLFWLDACAGIQECTLSVNRFWEWCNILYYLRYHILIIEAVFKQSNRHFIQTSIGLVCFRPLIRLFNSTVSDVLQRMKGAGWFNRVEIAYSETV